MKVVTTNTLPKFNERKCKACGTCIDACPERTIEIRGFRFWVIRHEHAVLAYPEHCTRCGACVKACPEGAWSL